MQKNKITIIEADAIKFMENLEDGKYDYCFADIWESNIDIAPYLKLKPLEKKFKHMECGYWLEFNMIASNIPSLLLMFMTDGFEYKSKMNNLPPQLEPIKKFVEEVYKKDVYIKEPEIIKYYINHYNIIEAINQKYQSE